MGMKGFEQVNQRFKTAMDNLGVSRTRRVVEEITGTVMTEATTMIPIGKTGNLAGSGYTRTWRGSSGWGGETGFGGNGKGAYAIYVHEASGKLKGQPRSNGVGNYWDPTGEPQFLAKAVRNVTAYDIPKIIRSQYAI